jgi:hypothetical protein
MTTQELELSADLVNYNSAKEAIVNGLVREGFLTEEQGTTIKNQYAVALVKNNWFGDAISKLLSRENVVYLKLVKIV